jgi:hypothetical protein
VAFWDIADQSQVLVMWAKECRRRAEECEQLARETTEAYAKEALLELAAEFWREAELCEEKERSRTKR